MDPTEETMGESTTKKKKKKNKKKNKNKDKEDGVVEGGHLGGGRIFNPDLNLKVPEQERAGDGYMSHR
jgi:hypothetical protein